MACGSINPMQILAAPIQEYTDAPFRNAHCRTIGGIDEYYAPFIRLEQGALSRRSERDLDPANNRCPNMVPQVLVKNAQETAILLEKLANLGYRRVDFNFGCPFPKVVKAHYGAGILALPEAIREVMTAACDDGRLRCSVKLRLGIHDADQWRQLLPILNDFPLEKVVLHPRTAEQQYDGVPDRTRFEEFRSQCAHPLFFNGDIRQVEDAKDLEELMLGRGLLADPLLPRKLRQLPLPAGLLQAFHDAYLEECLNLYQQPLQKLKLLWNYFLPSADKHLRKAIQKAKALEEYQTLTEGVFE